MIFKVQSLFVKHIIIIEKIYDEFRRLEDT